MAIGANRNRMKALVWIVLLVTLSACNQPQKVAEARTALLLADREAPLGWVYLRLFDDQHFEFESAGLRKGVVFPGTYQLRGDTLFLNYTDSVPAAGSMAIIAKGSVAFLNGTYPERVKIKHNQLIP